MGKTRIDHIGIIVADLDQAAKALAPLFGAPSRTRTLDDAGLRIMELEAANVTIELLEYSGPNDGFARRVMGDALGLNHISARVDDVEASVAALGAAGFKVMDGFPRQGAHGLIAFFEPDPTTGLLFEICAPDDGDDP